MPRYKLTVEYDGTPYCGWQSQSNGEGVQDKVEDAIEKLTGSRIGTQAAGRTDSGVHALGQVIHFDTIKAYDPFRVAEAINYHLKPHPISIVAWEEVGTDFEARFSAKARHYEYQILNRKARPALDHMRVWHVPQPLDEKAMHEAGQLILGKHDFTTFRASLCQAKSPIKTLDRLDVSREGDTVYINASAQSFLHNQVRSLVGSLKLVGEGKWTPQDFRAALDAVDRQACGPVAPAHGLYLTQVDY
jgi:tRNA pseudouridine38-40 synthase